MKHGKFSGTDSEFTLDDTGKADDDFSEKKPREKFVLTEDDFITPLKRKPLRAVSLLNPPRKSKHLKPSEKKIRFPKIKNGVIPEKKETKEHREKKNISPEDELIHSIEDEGVKVSLRTKIAAITVITSLLAAVSVGVFGITMLLHVRNDVADSIGRLSDFFTNNINSAMIVTGTADVEKAAKSRAKTADKWVDNTARSVSAVSDLLTDMYSYPARYPRTKVMYPASPSRTNAVIKLTAREIANSEDAAVVNELAAFAGVQDSLLSLSLEASAGFAGTESGIMLMADSKDKLKTLEGRAGFDCRKQLWYKAAMESPGQLVMRHNTISNPLTDKAVFISRTFSDKNGKIKGVVGAALYYDDFARLFTEKSIPILNADKPAATAASASADYAAGNAADDFNAENTADDFNAENTAETFNDENDGTDAEVVTASIATETLFEPFESEAAAEPAEITEAAAEEPVAAEEIEAAEKTEEVAAEEPTDYILITDENGDMVASTFGNTPVDTGFLDATVPIESLGWNLQMYYPTKDMLKSAVYNRESIKIQADETANRNDHVMGFVRNLIIAISGVVTFLTAMYAVRFSKRFIMPVYELISGTHVVAQGDTEYKIVINSGDEIELLAKNFNFMTNRLRNYIDMVSKASAEKERLESEIGIATRIQVQALPNFEDFVSQTSCVDLFSTMTPAKEVGGDFFDFFRIDHTHIALLIADVSGKGVPAALFMMKGKALVKTSMMSGLSPGAAMEMVNSQLCDGNDEGLFITAFLAVLDTTTGTLQCVNAGHNPPVISGRDGLRWVKKRSGMFLAGLETMRYKVFEEQMNPGDTIFFYTDGVTEALDADDEEYGDSRLDAILSSVPYCTQAKIVSDIVWNDIGKFVGTAEKSDDITMLVVRLMELEKRKIKIVVAREDELDDVLEFTETQVSELTGITDKVLNQILICVEEIFLNVANYAYDGEEGDVIIEIEITEEDVQIQFTDSGKKYNPLQAPPPDLGKPLAERDIGGLGLHMVKQLMNQVDYSYMSGKNVLVMKKSV